jgi:hypothetical protein
MSAGPVRHGLFLRNPHAWQEEKAEGDNGAEEACNDE